HAFSLAHHSLVQRINAAPKHERALQNERAAATKNRDSRLRSRLLILAQARRVRGKVGRGTQLRRDGITSSEQPWPLQRDAFRAPSSWPVIAYVAFFCCFDCRTLP